MVRRGKGAGGGKEKFSREGGKGGARNHLGPGGNTPVDRTGDICGHYGGEEKYPAFKGRRSTPRRGVSSQTITTRKKRSVVQTRNRLPKEGKRGAKGNRGGTEEDTQESASGRQEGEGRH